MTNKFSRSQILKASVRSLLEPQLQRAFPLLLVMSQRKHSQVSEHSLRLTQFQMGVLMLLKYGFFKRITMILPDYDFPYRVTPLGILPLASIG